MRYGWVWQLGVSLLVGLALSASMQRASGASVDNLPAAPPAGTNPGKVVGPVPQPVPGGSAISGAEKLLKEVHGPALNRTSPAEMDALAQTLIGEARQAENAGEQWVLLREARDRAARAGDSMLAASAAAATAERFDLDPRALMSDVLSALAATSNPTPEAAAVELELARRCFSQAEFELAGKALDAAKATARQAHNQTALEQVMLAAPSIESAVEAYRQAASALQKLPAQPGDPALCEEVGRYDCFVLGDWAGGLPLLAKGSDAALKSLATRELGPAPSPADSLALADGWIAEAVKDPADLASIHHHAEDWYHRAIERLEGLSRLAAEKHLQQLATQRLEPGVDCEMFIGRSFERRMLTRIDPQIAFEWNGQPPAQGVPGQCFSARFTGWIKPPAAGEYKIVVKHDDGARLWIDGRPYIDNWMMGVATDEASVELSGGYHELRLEYEQGEAGSHLTLAWATPGDPSINPIPPEVFFHEPLDIPLLLQTRLAPDADGTFHLMAAFAEPHGPDARYIDDDGSSPAISGFQHLETYASWDVVVPEGKYALELTFSCDGSAGGEYLVTVGPAGFRGTSENTGGWNHPRTYALGAVKLPPGPHRITIRSTTTPNPYALHVNEIALRPKK